MRKTLRGYRRLNKLTAEEERAWAARLTPKESRQIFIELQEVWEKTRAQSDEDWQVIDRMRIDELIQAQRPWVKLAKRMSKR